jgi:FkbM family methyltransferase
MAADLQSGKSAASDQRSAYLFFTADIILPLPRFAYLTGRKNAMLFLGSRTATHLKFRGRAWLTRLGWWNRLERWRLGRRYRARRAHEQEFAFFRRFDGSTTLFVDIGANIGQSALSFRTYNRTCPILSFEPNVELEPYLRYVKRLLGPGFDYRMHGLGAENREMTFHFPVARGVPLMQEATLLPDLLHSEEVRQHIFERTGCRRYKVTQKTLRLVKFDDLGLRPGLVKMDVQGAELQVLEGMAQTIERTRPIFLIEGYAHVQDFLAARGYRYFVYNAKRDALEPHTGQQKVWNYFFVPQELSEQQLVLGKPDATPP